MLRAVPTLTASPCGAGKDLADLNGTSAPAASDLADLAAEDVEDHVADLAPPDLRGADRASSPQIPGGLSPIDRHSDVNWAVRLETRDPELGVEITGHP
jgi:hypothetical protein